MDTVQILLYTVVGILTVLLLLLGVQVFFILREIRGTISKANKVLDDAGIISTSISRPVESFSTIMSGVKVGSLVASFLANKKRKMREEEVHAHRE